MSELARAIEARHKRNFEEELIHAQKATLCVFLFAVVFFLTWCVTWN